ncbi:uncharacterized protein LOC141842329 [Curcuma longa]|uniref:uncharacterized protein LOC141842329 n=1 Tax=Curcuma longa TaxID=136217 RepID=UPI003D9EAAD3
MISMAVAFSHSNIIIPRSQTEKIRRRSCLCHNNNNTSEASVSVSVNKFSRGAKVFEDQDMGVICFRDDKGEIVCEGFDEGPRFDQPILARRRPSRRNRELQSIPSFLQILMAEEGDEFYRFTCN